MMVKALRLLARRHMTERPLRTAITILGVALGVSVSVAIRTANVEVLRSFKEAVDSVAGRATLQITGHDLGFDERVIVAVRDHPDVISATPVLSLAATVVTGLQRGKTLHLLGLDLLEATDLKDFQVQLEGTKEQVLDSLLAPNAVFIGTALAEEWSLETGSSLVLAVGTGRYQVVVRGVVGTTRGVPSVWDHLAVMDIAAAQELFGLVGRLDRIDIVTGPAQSVERVAGELRRRLPQALEVTRPSHRNEQVERMVRAFQLNLTTMSAIGLLVGLLLVYNTVSYAVVQRRREIGIFRALGMRRAGVTTLFMVEGGFMGLVGGLAGGWLGVMFSHHLVSLLKRSVSELYAPVPTIRSAFGPDLMGLLLESALLGLVVSVIGAVGPSVEASRTQPARALAPGQYQEAQEMQAGRLAWTGVGGLVLALLLAFPGPVWGLPLLGYASAFFLLVGLSCLTPGLLLGVGTWLRSERTFGAHGTARGTLSRLAADQVVRSPGRNAVTVSALMVGVAIMVGVGIMVQSFRQTVEHWIDQTIMADLVLAPTAWPLAEQGPSQTHRIPLAVAEVVASIPGVAAVDTYREMKIEVEGRPVSLVSRDLRVHAQWSRYLFLEGDSSATLRRTVEKDGVILSEVLARTLGLRPGSRLTLGTPSGERSFPVMGVFYDYATDGGKAVMDRRLFRRLWSDETTTVIPVYLAPGADVTAVVQRLEERVGRGGNLAILRNAGIKAQILAIFDRTFIVTYALELITVTIALLGIANTILTSVLERQREIATLRAIGASRTQIRRLLLWETSYLGLMGAMMGVCAGVLLSVLLITVINRQSFGWTIRFTLPAGLLVEGIVLALGAALAAGYLPAVWAGKQPVAEGLRYE